MSKKVDYLTEDSLNPSDQLFVCVSFFSKHYVKQAIENNNDYRKEEDKEEYSTENDVLAFKFRGAFSTYEDACEHAKILRDVDKYHNVYVMESGKWCAFMVSEDEKYVNQTEHANEELNDMMKKYMENQIKAKVYHEYRKNQMMQESIEENLQNRLNTKELTDTELKNTTDKTNRKTLKDKKEVIDEQIKKLEEKKKEIEEKTRLLSDQLKK